MEKLIGRNSVTLCFLILTSANFLTGTDTFGTEHLDVQQIVIYFQQYISFHFSWTQEKYQCCFLNCMHLICVQLVSRLWLLSATRSWDSLCQFHSQEMASFFCSNFTLGVAVDPCLWHNISTKPLIIVQFLNLSYSYCLRSCSSWVCTSPCCLID